MTTDKVWEMWAGWDPLHGFLFEQGLVSNEPLHDTLLK